MTLVRTDILEEHATSIIRVERIGELGTKLAVTRRRYIPLKYQFIQEPHDVRSQKMIFFIISVTMK
jgi:hypothetical protein